MASTIQYVGRSTTFKGKTLWEICGNLKNYGVGRYVIRNHFQRYPEPCFMKILKVETLPTEEPYRKIRVYVDNTFRGYRHNKPVEIESTSYKADYQLMPRDWTPPKCETPPVKVVPDTMELPPLLREIVIKETGAKEAPKIPLAIRQPRRNNRYVKKSLAESSSPPSS